MSAEIKLCFLTLSGWRTTFRCLSGAASFLFIAAWLYKPLHHQRVKNEESAHPCVDLNIWRNKAFIVWVLSISFFLFGYFIPFVHLVSSLGRPEKILVIVGNRKCCVVCRGGM